MAIIGVKLTNTSKAGYVVNALHLICCTLSKQNNIAYLFGDEVSNISPRQNVQALPDLTAKILSEINRRGLIFHVAPHRGSHGIFIASNNKSLSDIS